MLKKTVLFFLILFFILNPSPVFAIEYRTESNTVQTQVGNPPVPSNDLVKAAEDIKNAYDSCSNGYTYKKPELGNCLKNALKNLGYSDGILDAFERRREKSITTINRCTECLGFVALTLTLISGDDNTLVYYSASRVANLPSFTTSDDSTYIKLSPQEPIQQGDIAAKGGGDGHIAIVKERDPDFNTFIGIESNNNSDCKVTNNISHVVNQFVFFRRQ